MDEETARIISEMRHEIDKLKAIELPTKGCVARYTTNAGQSIDNATATIVDFEDVSIDTDSAVTVGAAWKFTCPAGKAGYYLVTAVIAFDTSATWAAGELVILYLYKNNALYSVLLRKTQESATTLYNMPPGSDVVYLAAGDYIDVRVNQGSGGALALYTNSYYNRVAISRQ